MNVSSLQKRVAKSFAFDVDGLRLIQSIAQSHKSHATPEQLAAAILCQPAQAKAILDLPHSVVTIHALERFYAKQEIATSLYGDEAEALRAQFFVQYIALIKVYQETVELIGLNASIEQVLELSTSRVFKRRDWPKIRFIFAEEIESIYHQHQELKRAKLNKGDDEIQLEWNEHIKHSKGRKLSVADKVRIQQVMTEFQFQPHDLTKGSVLIAIAKHALVDIVQINQIF